MANKKLMDNHNRKLILSEVIKRDGEGCTAYGLLKECSFDISISAISQHLKKLEEERFICGEVCDTIIQQGRYKKTYKITENGKCKILESIEEDVSLIVTKMSIKDRIEFLNRIEEILMLKEVNK
ncbi:MAG: hypothetical protein SVM80_01120 [Halobacteriota archaeon]|nr:hypothetical protein [Halobacteriota archaeon]